MQHVICTYKHSFAPLFNPRRITHHPKTRQGDPTSIVSSKMPSTACSFYVSRMCGGNSSYQSEPCTVSCPIDCQMSAWSEWGLCDSNCAYGLKNRSSKVVRLASVGGRPCPGPSVQYALCNYPCENFSWLTSPWSECRLVNDAAKKCGRGRKSRTIR